MGVLDALVENLIGTMPSTRSAGDFTGDILGGLTNPHGILGQAGRALITLGAVNQSGIGGLAAATKFFQDQDAQQRAEYEYGALNQMSPDDFYLKFGHDPQSWIPQKAVDMAPGGPSRGTQAIDFPVDPEAAYKNQVLQTQKARSAPDFQGSSDTYAQAERMKLPTDFREATASVDEQKGKIDTGRYRTSTEIIPSGPHVGIVERDPFQAALTAAEISQLQKSNPDYSVSVIPGPPDPETGEPRSFIHEHPKYHENLTMADYIALAAKGDPGAQQIIKYQRDAAIADFKEKRDIIRAGKAPASEKGSLPERQAKKWATENGYDWEKIPIDLQNQVVKGMKMGTAVPRTDDDPYGIKASMPKMKDAKPAETADTVLENTLNKLHQYGSDKPLGQILDSPQAAAKSMSKASPTPSATPRAGETPVAPEIAGKKKQLAEKLNARNLDEPGLRALAKMLNKSGGSKDQKIEIARGILEQTGASPEQIMQAFQILAGLLS